MGSCLFSKSVYYHNKELIQDDNCRYVMVVGTIEGVSVTILNIYAPNKDCPHFFKKLASILADKGKGIILKGGGGDLTVYLTWN